MISLYHLNGSLNCNGIWIQIKREHSEIVTSTASKSGTITLNFYFIFNQLWEEQLLSNCEATIIPRDNFLIQHMLPQVTKSYCQSKCMSSGCPVHHLSLIYCNITSVIYSRPHEHGHTWEKVIDPFTCLLPWFMLWRVKSKYLETVKQAESYWYIQLYSIMMVGIDTVIIRQPITYECMLSWVFFCVIFSVLHGFKWSTNPYSSWLPHWYWNNCIIDPVYMKKLKDIS